jgi:prevent-host-death family protein
MGIFLLFGEGKQNQLQPAWALRSSLHIRTQSRTIRPMKTITASEARTNLYKLIDETTVTSEPVQITGKRADAVLVSMDDWRAIQETLYLLSIPGMRASIRKGLATPVKECLESLDW